MKSRNRAALVMIGAVAAGLITLNACGVKEGGAPDLDVRYRCSGPPQTCLKLSASWTWGGAIAIDSTTGDLSAIRLTDGRIRIYGGRALGSNLRAIESYVSDDGIHFTKEAGYRLYGVGIHMPMFTRMNDGSIRAYYVDQSIITPQPVRSAISTDGGLVFTLEDGERLVKSGTGYELWDVGNTRVVRTNEGDFRIYYNVASDHTRTLSARSPDGLHFTREPGVRLDAQDYCPAQTGMGGAPVLAADGLYHFYVKATRCTGDWINAATGLYDMTSTDGLTFIMPPAPLVYMYYIESRYHGSATDPALVPFDPTAVQTPEGMRVFFALYENPSPLGTPAKGFYTILNGSLRSRD